MGFTLLTGGAAAGKSRLAIDLAEATGSPVTVIATATAGDEEMAARIARHQRERPSQWGLIEEPRHLAEAVASVDADHFVIVDCLTLWVSNRLDDPADEVLAEADHAATALVRRGEGVVVTNEVGWGIVPADPVSRGYRDLLGRVNRTFADRADQAWLVVAGRRLALEEHDA